MSTNETLQERATEYAKRTNDYGDWCMVDLVREYEADTGERVSHGALAFAMLDFIAADYRADLEDLTSDDDWEEDVKRDQIKSELRDIERVQNGIEAAERGEYVHRADVRALLHEWSVVPECRGCRGGKAALCGACQARFLPAALSASVAAVTGHPTAVLPPRPVSLVPLRKPQPYPPSDDLETVRPAHDDVA